MKYNQLTDLQSLHSVDDLENIFTELCYEVAIEIKVLRIRHHSIYQQHVHLQGYYQVNGLQTSFTLRYDCHHAQYYLYCGPFYNRPVQNLQEVLHTVMAARLLWKNKPSLC